MSSSHKFHRLKNTDDQTPADQEPGRRDRLDQSLPPVVQDYSHSDSDRTKKVNHEKIISKYTFPRSGNQPNNTVRAKHLAQLQDTVDNGWRDGILIDLGLRHIHGEIQKRRRNLAAEIHIFDSSFYKKLTGGIE
ncbi:hypothetical protein EC991_001646 [Linnemannia zychae]|nr:hypothetical protein EC991_001646 [Linnemannia zychae]